MNIIRGGSSSSSLESSSGCESGWTLYLENSSGSSFGRNASSKVKKISEDYYYNNYEDVEEDLSMVSDASSGPPHFDHHDIDDDDDEVQGFCYGGRKKRSANFSMTHHDDDHQCFKALQHDFSIDDTASSPIFNTSNKKSNNGDYKKGSSFKRMIDYSSQGFSTNHIPQEKSSNFEEHYCGFIQPPMSAKQFRQNQWS